MHMKKLALLVPLVLITLLMSAQTVVPSGVLLKKQALPYTPPSVSQGQGSSRVAQEIRLDYFSNEFNEANTAGSNPLYLPWAVNNAFDVFCTPTVDTTDFASLKWAGVRFDSIFDLNSGTVYDIATTSIIVDTVYVTIAEHQNNSGLNDTIVLRIMEVNAASVSTVDRGLTYQAGSNDDVISNNVLWSDTLIFNVGLTSTFGTLSFPVNGGTAGGLTIPSPEDGFIVMLDYFGPKIDTFFIADMNNFACGGGSLPVTSFVPSTSLSYVNYNFVSAGICTDLSGVDDLVAGSGAPCNVFYRQNMGIATSVRVDQISQSCGTATGTPGFRPDTNNVPCIVQNIAYQETVEFELPATFGPFTLNSMTIDSITNMPCGIAYALDRPNATYGPGDVGCVTYSGTSNDPIGQYKLNIFVTIDVQTIGVMQGELSDLAGQLGYYGFSQYLRVKASSGAACPNIGTPSQNLTSSGATCVVANPLSVTATAAPSTICAGSSSTLSAGGVGGSGSYTYTWMPGNLSGASVVVTPASTTTYTVTVNDGNSTANTTVTVTVMPSVTPSVNISANSGLCSNSALLLLADVTNGGTSPTYQWTVNNGPSVSNTDTYLNNSGLNTGDIVRVTITSDATCASPTTATSSVTIVNCAAPLSVTASGGTTACAGVSTVLSAAGAGGTGSYTYTWMPGSLTGSSVTVSPSSTTTYTVTVNDGSNTATDNVTVIVDPSVTPSVNISNNQATLCSGQAFTFTANQINGGSSPSYNWTLNSNTISTSASYAAGVLNAGDVVSVTMTSNAACASPTTATASVTIANCSGPLSVTATSGSAVCAGSSATLTATGNGGSGNYTYTWMPGNLSGASVTVSPATTTTYTVTVNDGSTTSTSTTTVTVNALPTANAGNDVTICTGGSATLTATGGSNYTWSPAAGLSCTNCAQPVATPTSSAVYSVTVTDGNGCTATDEVVVSVSTTALAEVTITADDDTICAGSSYTFTASPVNGGTPTYQWTLNGNNVGTNSASLVLANLAEDDEIACVMTSSLGCVTNSTATSNTLTVVDCSVGVLDIAKQNLNINVMPNPSTGLFFVNLADVTGNATVEVFNMQGQRVFTEATDKATLSVDLGEFGQGLYLMRVSTENGAATKKLIKE